MTSKKITGYNVYGRTVNPVRSSPVRKWFASIGKIYRCWRKLL